MKVAVIGGNGQLGNDVGAAFTVAGYEVRSYTHSDIELANLDSVSSGLEAFKPGVIVNTAAMHHVEKCEKEPEKAFAVNALGPKNLSLVANALSAALVHVSTDYVFDGAKRTPYVEEDAPCPLNVYGNTKLAGEYFIYSTAKKYFVLRTSAIYGSNPCRAKGGLNFVELMLKLAKERKELRVVDSEFVTPTPTADLARQIVKLSGTDRYGLYHATAEGSCSWYQFACEIFRRTNTTINLQVAGPNEFPAKVPRPLYSVLENRALKKCDLNVFRSWQEGLDEYLKSRQ